MPIILTLSLLTVFVYEMSHCLYIICKYDFIASSENNTNVCQMSK